MRPQISINKLLLESSTVSRESPALKDFLSNMADRIKTATPGIEARSTELYSRSGGLDQLEEFTINTGKPYVDNSLSGYSAFKELISYYNEGFRACLVLPVKDDNKALGNITLLSRAQDAFDNEAIDSLLFLSQQISKDASLKIEKEKSSTVAKYFDAAFNNSTPQLLVDKNGGIIKANKATMNLFDRTGKELSGRNFHDFIEMDDAAAGKLFAGSQVYSKTRLGEERYLRLASNAINERLAHLSIIDITDIKQMEDRAKFADNSDDEAFMLLDSQGKILWASENSDRILNVDRNALIGNAFPDFVYDNTSIISKLRSAGSPFTSSIKLNFGNGVVLPAKLKAYKNAFGSSVILSRDYQSYINVIKKSIDDMINLSGDAIFILDDMGYIKSQNRSAQKLLRYRDSIEGVPVLSLCADQDSQSKLSGALALARQADVINDLFVYFHSGKADERIPIMQNVKPIRDENNVLLGFMMFGKELLSEQRINDLQEGINKMENLAKKQKTDSDLKTQFIYNISHELKTPITNISGFSKFMLEGSAGELNSAQKEYMQIIVDELGRLMGLIQQILDLLKLESGRMKLDLQPVNLAELMDNPSIRSFKEVCEGKGLYFELHPDYNIPSVMADPNRLIQVFVNLIGNSVKFTEQGGITIRMMRKGKNVRVEVSDTGIGMSREDIKNKLFKKFYQIQRKELALPKGSGTGLGLAITKEIINKHGGKMDAVSEGQGKGSTFWFTLPITPKTKKRSQDQAQQQREQQEEQQVQ